MISLIVGIIIGLAIGAGLLYLFTQKNQEEQQQKYLEQTRQLRQELERNHELRKQEMIQSLQSDHQKELKALAATHELQKQEILAALGTPLGMATSDAITLIEDPEFDIPSSSEIAATPEVSSIKPVAPLEETVIPVTPPQVIQEPAIVISPIEETPNPADKSNEKLDVFYRPTNQELSQKIMALGESGNERYIPQLTALIYHPDGSIRQQVASALGKITSFKNIRSATQKVLPVLEKLTKDSDHLVRQAAVEALGKIKSEQVIPLLQKALRDSNGDVVKAASNALTQVKFYRVSQAVKPVKTTAKQLNH